MVQCRNCIYCNSAGAILCKKWHLQNPWDIKDKEANEKECNDFIEDE